MCHAGLTGNNVECPPCAGFFVSYIYGHTGQRTSAELLCTGSIEWAEINPVIGAMMQTTPQYMLSTVLLSLCLVSTAVLAEKIDGVHEADKATEISQIAVPKSPTGFFFRGDSRHPTHPYGEGIFDTGFIPQGNNPDLLAHLSFRGQSGYVSTSRSDIAAQYYMFGQTGARASDGYLYVIAPDNLADGYWVPGIYRRDLAVQRNLEYAVFGAISPENIAGAFHYMSSDTQPVEWIPNPHYRYTENSPYNPSRDRYFQDICGAIAGIAAYLCFKRPAP